MADFSKKARPKQISKQKKNKQFVDHMKSRVFIIKKYTSVILDMLICPKRRSEGINVTVKKEEGGYAKSNKITAIKEIYVSVTN